MIGCHIGRIFQVTVAGGSYQEGLTSILQGVPPVVQMHGKEFVVNVENAKAQGRPPTSFSGTESTEARRTRKTQAWTHKQRSLKPLYKS